MSVLESQYNRSIDTQAMPDRIRRLPISPKGYPVPWFVVWFKDGKPCEDGDGEPDFRVTDPRKIAQATNNKRCWVCGGGPLGIYKCFVIGPMCAINRVISEPPEHRECAIFSARFCPFLSQPRMRRNEKDMYPERVDAAGFALKRNPGVACVWITKSFRPFKPHMGEQGVLFSLGQPVEVLWFAEGRKATRAEVLASIDSGFPSLQDIARLEGRDAVEALEAQRTVAMALVPAA